MTRATQLLALVLAALIAFVAVGGIVDAGAMTGAAAKHHAKHGKGHSSS